MSSIIPPRYKTIGILGGMGPLATVDLFQKIIQNTKAGTDQEHIPVLVNSNTRIPDRTAAIDAGGQAPVEEMVRAALQLECAGAQLIAVPCNTAHHFLPLVAAVVRVPVLNMIEETVRAVKGQGAKRVALLATRGTIRASLYEGACTAQGVELILPDETQQALLMRWIYGIKGGGEEIAPQDITSLLDALKVRGAEVFILGCTELPIAFSRMGLEAPFVDPTLELAKAAIQQAGGTLA